MAAAPLAVLTRHPGLVEHRAEQLAHVLFVMPGRRAAGHLGQQRGRVVRPF